MVNRFFLDVPGTLVSIFTICDNIANQTMWRNHNREIDDLKSRVQSLELQLSEEKAARLADKLDALQKMQVIHENLAGSISGLKTVKREPRVPVARSTPGISEFLRRAQGEVECCIRGFNVPGVRSSGFKPISSTP